MPEAELFDRAWPPPPDPRSWRIVRDGLRIEPRSLGILHLVAGDVAAALRAFGIVGPALGWPETVREPRFALRLGRDGVLIVGGALLPDGWHETGFASNLVTDAYVALALAGPRAAAVLSQLMPEYPTPASPSALFLIEGILTAVCRRDEPKETLILIPHVRFAGFATLLSAIADS